MKLYPSCSLLTASTPLQGSIIAKSNATHNSIQHCFDKSGDNEKTKVKTEGLLVRQGTQTFGKDVCPLALCPFGGKGTM